MIEPEVGQTYVVHHSRKGTFTVRMLAVYDDWIEGEVVDGEVKYLARPYGESGEKVSMRRSLVSLEATDAPTE
jgi:hypothetical protein